MARVTVYQFEIYDPSDGKMHLSRQWATRQAIKQHGLAGAAIGMIVEETGIEVDSMALDRNGMTAIGFDPVYNRSAGG